jgi:hypothetical protein
LQVEYTEEENSVLVLKNLKCLCDMNSPGLMRIGLGSFMDTLASIKSSNTTDDYPAWAVELTTLMTAWIPIQYRYLTVLTCLEDLEACPPSRHIAISTPEQELTLTILEGILMTEESLIGLNVIDVLNTLITQIQLTVHPTNETDIVQKLVNCVIGLAGHIYYTDQIRDMCAEIMQWSSPLFSAPPISPANQGDSDALDVKTAAVWSLRILKGVLAKGGGRVSLKEVWVDTEYGLATQDGEVRIAYIDALVTHIHCEDTGEEPEKVCHNVGY